MGSVETAKEIKEKALAMGAKAGFQNPLEGVDSLRSLS
jgi:hypothetical protein